MRVLAVIAALALASGVKAGPVAVSSGEHPGFTRLVFDYGATVDWQFGRSADGYAMRVNGLQPAYDLRGVFQPIGTTRLAAIWPDPATGDLHIGIACACHAIPFEFRPGVIVVDLREGPPPEGSSFETMMDGTMAAALSPSPRPRPRARPRALSEPYDWLARTITDLPVPQKAGAPMHAPPDPYGIALAATLEPLRKQLLAQISLGATQGIVDMTLPAKGQHSDLSGDFASAQINIGGNRGSLIHDEQPQGGTLGASGNACIAAERLDIANWATAAPIADQWATAMADLVGEFDQPSPEALARAVRFNLFLGNGAEARQLLHAFGTKLGESALWQSMSYVLDDDSGDLAPLVGQTACDGPAALWSVLAEAGPLPKTANSAAIRLAFSELPSHLRTLLGPRIAQRFLDTGDAESARAIRDATIRTGPESEDAAIALVGAEIADMAGDPQAAEDRLRQISDRGGRGAIQALAGLVEMRARRGLAVKPTDVSALEASSAEWGKSNQDISTAILLGRAASGDPAGAFDMVSEHPEMEPKVWSLLADLGTDRQILELAVLPTGTKTKTREGTGIKLATRLLQLGLPQPAAQWLDDSDAKEPLLRAQLKLALSSPADALALLAGQSAPEAITLRVGALTQLGDAHGAADILKGTGDIAAAQLAMNRAGAWSELAATAESPLQKLAADLSTVTATAKAEPTDGQLARTHALIGASERTRGLIADLLAAPPAS